MANCKDCVCSEVCYYKSFNDVRKLEKRRNDVEKICKSFVHRDSIKSPTVDAVPVEQYKVLLERYHELRENFIDYYCSGIPNVSPYCLNRCEDCVNTFGWCKYNSDKCRGFNPAEVIIYDERRTNGETETT